ncbi:MAG: adenylate/guanylate cyclase domain-containing protein, partial [Candidatus Wallbacteria bacterium]|nr:adenylate/guanylate cyclase domain-containing protein [Candidatus Wallbacteria bacterium]
VCSFFALAGIVGLAAANRARRNLVTLARLQMLRQYVHEGAVERVLDENVDQALAVGGRSVAVTILSSDLRGFTAMSSGMAPETVVAQLNEFHGAMLEQVKLHGGILDKFIGDGMLAVFGLSRSDAIPSAAASAAISCARGMITALEELNRKRSARGETPLAIGIGIHSGQVVAGAIGAPGHRLEFTVLGDTVNTASRLESATKQLKSPIAVSGDTAFLAGISNLRPLGKVELRGKPEPIEVFTVS